MTEPKSKLYDLIELSTNETAFLSWGYYHPIDKILSVTLSFGGFLNITLYPDELRECVDVVNRTLKITQKPDLDKTKVHDFVWDEVENCDPPFLTFGEFGSEGELSVTLVINHATAITQELGDFQLFTEFINLTLEKFDELNLEDSLTDPNFQFAVQTETKH